MSRSVRIATVSEYLETVVLRDVVQKTYQIEPLGIIGTSPFPYAEVYVIIDTSRSTQCINDSCDIYGISDDVSMTTKGIILAECEGIAKLFKEMIGKFDLKGVVVKIYSFSNITHLAKEVIITDSKVFYETVISMMPTFLPYFSDGTNLTDAFDVLRKDFDQFHHINKNKKLIILATDGKADSPEDALLAFESAFRHSPFDAFICGAGNIGADIEGSFFSTKGNKYTSAKITESEVTRTARTIHSRQSNHGQSRGIEYLDKLAKIPDNTQYFGAYGDYSHFLECLNSFFTRTFPKTLTWSQFHKFSMNNTPAEAIDSTDTLLGYRKPKDLGAGTWITYSDEVNTILRRGKGCLFKVSKVSSARPSVFIAVPMFTPNSKTGKHQDDFDRHQNTSFHDDFDRHQNTSFHDNFDRHQNTSFHDNSTDVLGGGYQIRVAELLHRGYPTSPDQLIEFDPQDKIYNNFFNKTLMCMLNEKSNHAIRINLIDLSIVFYSGFQFVKQIDVFEY